MQQYLELANHILNTGIPKADRTGTGTISVFGYQMRFNLQDGFPLVTTKKVHLKSIIGELLWFLSGSTNANELREKYGVTIWDEWAGKDGSLGRIYGAQWRSWSEPNGDSVDQIADAIRTLSTNPDSRRIIVSAWNVGELDQMNLHPCHALFQFYVANGKLSCQLYQRSADVFLGVPFNIASYALLTMMVAKQVNLLPGEFIWTGGDCHIYTNHIEQMKLQLSRQPHTLPIMKINPDVQDIFSYTPEDFNLVNYVSHPTIKGAVSV